jgi:hypothetical protein
MAIVLLGRRAPEAQDTLHPEAIVLHRPAVLVTNGTFHSDDASASWTAILETHRAVLEAAIDAVARVEANDPVLPFFGTAFVIDKRFAVTANYVADLLLQRCRRSEGEQPGGPARIWLNFKAEHGSAASDCIDVRDIHPVHPYWGFAFLELEQDVDDRRVLKLAPKPSEDELKDRNICVIGYPALDVRNDSEQMKIIFKDVFDVKRLMPGKVTGVGHRGIENSVCLLHDATTTGGTGGAPLIDMETGCVLGVQVAGQYLVENQAAPAWEISRDPLWWRNLKDEKHVEVPDPAVVQHFDEVIALHTRLMKVGGTEEKIASLFAGLPNEYVAALPSKGNPTERLLAMLHDVNNQGGMIRGHSAFYYLLKNAERMRNWDTPWIEKIQSDLKTLLKRENARA